jgi:ubiquinone/menaquinone biosynthesis C-methylase UbiE/DNA-binding transcriptional ArsR family regulator
MASEALFAQLSALADPVRARLLLLLEERELAVGEACQVLQLPQSTVSRHLKVLQDEGWIASRSEGTRRNYRMRPAELDAAGRDVWSAVRQRVQDLPAAREDGHRLEHVLEQRRTRSAEFFSSAAGAWDSLRTELFGQRADLLPLLGLLDDRWTVADLGCGTGATTALLAPFVQRVIAVDGSAEMLEAARSRLAGAPNVALHRGTLEDVPLPGAVADAAVLSLVLHHVADPPRVLREAARLLRPGGRLLVVDMTPHEREEYRERMGHLWLGFAPETMQTWLASCGFEAVRWNALAPEADAQGPTLFTCTARRAAIPNHDARGTP